MAVQFSESTHKWPQHCVHNTTPGLVFLYVQLLLRMSLRQCCYWVSGLQIHPTDESPTNLPLSRIRNLPLARAEAEAGEAGGGAAVAVAAEGGGAWLAHHCLVPAPTQTWWPACIQRIAKSYLALDLSDGHNIRLKGFRRVFRNLNLWNKDFRRLATFVAKVFKGFLEIPTFGTMFIQRFLYIF